MFFSHAAAFAAVLMVPLAALADDANVTVYGLIDYGFASRSGNVSGSNQTAGRNGTLNEFAGGISRGNRIGFKGAEDLGNGLKAIFEIEFGFKGDDTASSTFNLNRHAFVGLTGGFGTVLGGRVDPPRYSFHGKYDPFANHTVANVASVIDYTSGIGTDRADNVIAYVTPELIPGFKVLAAYTTKLIGQEGTSAVAGQNIKTGDLPLWAIAGMYDSGPLSITLDIEDLTTKTNPDGHVGIYLLGASYDFGVVKLSGLYEYDKGRGARIDKGGSAVVLGVSAPVTSALKLMANYVDGRAKGTGTRDIDCRKFGIGGEYALSKRTVLYTTYARINADSNSTCAISLSGEINGNTADSTADPAHNGAYGRSGFDLGIRHSF